MLRRRRPRPPRPRLVRLRTGWTRARSSRQLPHCAHRPRFSSSVPPRARAAATVPSDAALRPKQLAKQKLAEREAKEREAEAARAKVRRGWQRLPRRAGSRGGDMGGRGRAVRDGAVSFKTPHAACAATAAPQARLTWGAIERAIIVARTQPRACTHARELRAHIALHTHARTHHVPPTIRTRAASRTRTRARSLARSLGFASRRLRRRPPSPPSSSAMSAASWTARAARPKTQIRTIRPPPSCGCASWRRRQTLSAWRDAPRRRAREQRRRRRCHRRRAATPSRLARAPRAEPAHAAP